MPDRRDRPAEAVAGLETYCAMWRSAFDRIAEEAGTSTSLFEEQLQDADSEDAYTSALEELSRVRNRGEQSIAALAKLIKPVKALHAEWRAARRYDEEVVVHLVAALAAKVAVPEPEAGAQEWLSQVFDALEAHEWGAVELLAGDGLAWPDGLDAGAQHMRGAFARWRAEDNAAALELMELLGEARLEGWADVLSPALRGRAHWLAAWVALRRLKDEELAEEHLGRAIELWPYAGRMHAERAAYYLSIGDLDMAATDAQRSVELAKDDAAGYQELGIWAELSGDFDDADAFYRKALGLLPTFGVTRLGTRVSLIDPPGRLLTRAAEVLLERRRPREALNIADQALQADLRGPELHPQAAAQMVRSLALERMQDHSAEEAAAAALEAGKLHAWNGDAKTAIERFERAEALDDTLQEVGWLLADARLSTSLPLGATSTDQTAVGQALETWERWAKRVGQPQADTSWAYLTRAMIADLGTQKEEADRLAGVWEALLYVEKAIVHDEMDAQRWGYAAQYLRYVHLDELAFEAADRGYKLGSGDRQVLAERLAQLTYRGRLEEADQVAEELVTMFGNDPWVSAARAWLAIHSDRETRYSDGLGLLELPLAGGNDPSWYYEMRAHCHLRLHKVDAAREDFHALLENALPIDGTTKCRLQVAAVAVADAEQAAHWSKEAAMDPTSRAISRLTADAFAAFSREDLDAATEKLSRATELAKSVIELRDIVDVMRLWLALLTDDSEVAVAHERALQAVAAGPVIERLRSLEADTVGPDQELEEAFAACADHATAPPLIRVALLAVRARRAAQAGRLGEAAASYQELLSSCFEPEATLGLTRALRGLAEQQVDIGDVEQVRRLTERMTALGHVSPADVVTAVAAALERSDRRSEAREQLETAIAIATDDREQAKLHQRAGGLALADDDLDAASLHFQAALETADKYGAHGRVGQVQIRMALIGVLRHDLVAAREHLLAAARAWKDGGALDPTAALLGELHGLQRLRGGRWEAAAREALALVETAVASEAAGRENEPLRRELGFR